MDDQLPHNDNDQQLARKIGQQLEAGASLKEMRDKDSLLNVLLSYKKQTKSFEAHAEEKQEVWQQIASKTKDTETPVTPLFNSSTLRWAAAAVLLIGALLSIFYFQFYQQPNLIAQSQATISTVELSDGSMVTLRPHSQLYALEQGNSNQQYKLQGEALFDVTSIPNRTFSVETETGRLSVHGTSFMISSWGEQMQVFLQEGSVTVQALNQDSSIVLQPGQSASIANKNSTPTLHTTPGQEFLDWLDHEMIFENRSAFFIAKEIEQQFNIQISLPADITDNKLTGQLSLQNLETALRDLEIVLGGQFTKNDTRSYTFEMD